jgi:hypothetical protein
MDSFLTVGKLYQYNPPDREEPRKDSQGRTLPKFYEQYNSDGKALYSTDPTQYKSFNMILGEMVQGDMFVPLETTEFITYLGPKKVPVKVFRILTTTGLIGWAYMSESNALEAEG